MSENRVWTGLAQLSEFDIRAARERAKARTAAEEKIKRAEAAAQADAMKYLHSKSQEATKQAEPIAQLLARFLHFARRQSSNTRESFRVELPLNSWWRRKYVFYKSIRVSGWRVSELRTEFSGSGYNDTSRTRVLLLDQDGTLYECSHHGDPRIPWTHPFKLEWSFRLEKDPPPPVLASIDPRLIVDRLGNWLFENNLDWDGE